MLDVKFLIYSNIWYVSAMYPISINLKCKKYKYIHLNCKNETEVKREKKYDIIYLSQLQISHLFTFFDRKSNFYTRLTVFHK